MSATTELIIKFGQLTLEEIVWLAAKSNQTGKPVNEVAKDQIRKSAERDGFVPPSPPAAFTPTKAA